MVTNVVSVCWDASAVTGPSEAWSWLYTLSNGCGFDTDGSHAESRTGRASAPLSIPAALEQQVGGCATRGIGRLVIINNRRGLSKISRKRVATVQTIHVAQTLALIIYLLFITKRPADTDISEWIFLIDY